MRRAYGPTDFLPDKYFMARLSLTQAEAYDLHTRYYKDYGLAIEGLVRHHKIDPLEYNSRVDDALPLEDVIVPDPKLKQLLQDLDRSKVRPWLFTNAYITHGKRVVKLLEVDDQFEGMTYCDYATTKFVCKPHPEMFAKAQQEAGVASPEQCYFVGMLKRSCDSSPQLGLADRGADDSGLNCKAAQSLGWTVAHLVEPSLPSPAEPASKYQISDLEELRGLFPQFFKRSQNGHV